MTSRFRLQTPETCDISSVSARARTRCRARASIPAALLPAVSGQHGDARHSSVAGCARIPAIESMPSRIHEWNSRCEPPWTERELVDKIQRARRYGREPLGGLLEARDA